MVLDDLSRIARAVAFQSIEDAIAQGRDPAEVSEAGDSLAEGDALRTAGQYKDAINKYKDTLAKVG